MTNETQIVNCRSIEEKLIRLRSVVGVGPLLVLTHDNPDPDSLASGKGLAALFEGKWGIRTHLRYSGLVGRAENKAMLRLLTPEWGRMKDDDLEQSSMVVLVDTQPGAGNNSLPLGRMPQIVIDHHHPVRDGLETVPFVDVRPDVGATVSLVYQYLDAAGVILDTMLATAIFYGIHADTRGLSRGVSPIDQMVYVQMLGQIDRHLLVQIEQAGLPREYFRSFSCGLQAARVYGRAVLANLGEINRPDFVAEMADLLIRLEDSQAVLCLGVHGEKIYLSLRTSREEIDAGKMIQKIVLLPGKAGGHGMMAGGQVPLLGRKIEGVAAEVEKRFLKVMGESGEGEPL